MLSFYALLFFLFTSVVAVPGYFVLKYPSDQNHFSCQVFKIVDREFSIFKLDKDFKIVPKSKRVLQGHEAQFLAGDWHNVPVRNSAAIDRLLELTVEANSPEMTSYYTDAPEPQPNPSGSHLLSKTCLEVANGYWVLGDATEAMPVETWRKILYVENGKYYTFELDDEFNIIGEKEKVDGPLPGDYFRIPFEGMRYFNRFAVLRVRKPKKGKFIIRVQYLDTPSGHSDHPLQHNQHSQQLC